MYAAFSSSKALPRRSLAPRSDGVALVGSLHAGATNRDTSRPTGSTTLPFGRVGASTGYFAGELRDFDALFGSAGRASSDRVVGARGDPYGTTIAYRELAARIGVPVRCARSARRMAETRCRLSSLPPARRGANGDLVGYGGGSIANDGSWPTSVHWRPRCAPDIGYAPLPRARPQSRSVTGRST